MKRLTFLVLMIAALALDALAQVSVEVRTDKDTFLLYESIPVAVSIHNQTGRTLQIASTDERPWLSFLITRAAGGMVESVGKMQVEDAILIPPGDTVRRTIDILPLYDLRSLGTYQIQAAVNANGMQAISSLIRVVILNGRDLWSQTVGLAAAGKTGDEYRTYSLVARSNRQQDSLYVCVKDEPHQLVFGLLPLGGLLTVVPPQARVDQRGDLHVLYQNGPRSFGYVQVDPSATIVKRAAYSDFSSQPRLVTLDGSVDVQGGEQTYPRPERVMTNGELNPPPPSPPPPPKKKWWWPFGPKTPPS